MRFAPVNLTGPGLEVHVVTPRGQFRKVHQRMSRALRKMVKRPLDSQKGHFCSVSQFSREKEVRQRWLRVTIPVLARKLPVFVV